MPSFMANDFDTGAAYLASLKRSSPARAAVQPSSSSPEGVGATSAAIPTIVQRPRVTEPQIIEKRRTPRYRCQGSARLHEIGGAPVWATFTDISLQGCYVEAPDPFRTGALVTLRLESAGFRIEAVGEVRVSYPGVGMGISFSRMSKRDQSQLQELVNSVSRASAVLDPRVMTHSLSIPTPDPGRAVKNPAAALQAVFSFFENRHMMGREEFLRIIRTTQDHEK